MDAEAGVVYLLDKQYMDGISSMASYEVTINLYTHDCHILGAGTPYWLLLKLPKGCPLLLLQRRKVCGHLNPNFIAWPLYWSGSQELQWVCALVALCVKPKPPVTCGSLCYPIG